MANAVAGGSAQSGVLEVRVLPDLIDFSKVNHLKVNLSYQDAENGVRQEGEIVLVANAREAAVWHVEIKDGRKDQYRWQATFSMKDGSTQSTPATVTDELTIIPQLG